MQKFGLRRLRNLPDTGPGKWVTCLCFIFLSESGGLHLSDKEHGREGLDYGCREDPAILGVKSPETRVSTGCKG